MAPPLGPSPDQLASWLRSVSNGDESALRQLYDATSPAVFGLALTVLGDRSTAEDVTLRIYLEVWRSAAALGRAGHDAGREIRGIALHEVLRCLRERAPAPT